MTPEEIEASRHLIHYYDGEGGWEPGSFTFHLIRALHTADHLSKYKLLAAFPQFKAPMRILEDEDGLAALQAMVTGGPTIK